MDTQETLNLVEEIRKTMEAVKPASLRDQFAIAVLQGFIGSEPQPSTNFMKEKNENIAFYCYKLADAMLKARTQKD